MKTELVTENPWDVLGLSESMATPEIVKRTYAQLLKRNRPDREPEAFMRLRAAYEAVRLLMRSSAQLHDENISMEQSPDLSVQIQALELPVTESLPTTVLQALNDLKQSVDSKVRQKIRMAWVAYDQACTSQLISAEVSWALFIEIFSGKIRLLADTSTDDFLIAQLKLGNLRLLRLVTESWGEHGEAKRLDEFCVSLSRERSLAESEIGALAMVAAAVALGAWNPEQASRLAQRAFPKLPTAQRSELATLVDIETMIGRLVLSIPNLSRQPWIQILRQGDASHPWKEIINRDLMVTLLRSCGPKWPGFAVLAQKLSHQAWTEMRTALEGLMR